jgi:hypothetical protein
MPFSYFSAKRKNQPVRKRSADFFRWVDFLSVMLALFICLASQDRIWDHRMKQAVLRLPYTNTHIHHLCPLVYLHRRARTHMCFQ